jgi:hypothetical protein
VGSFDRNLGNTEVSSLALLVTQMIRLPMLVIVCGVEIFTKTIHGFQRLADQSMDVLMRPGGVVPLPPSGAYAALPGAAAPAPPPVVPTISPVFTGPKDQQPQDARKELIKMPDTNLNDDMLKLVRYKILFIKRDYEVAFPEQEELVHDNMSDAAFTAWKVAEFIQSLDDTAVPKKWHNKRYPESLVERGGVSYIHSLPEEDKKYLRVYFEVMQRYVREKFKHEERQVEELEKIRKILERGGGGAPDAGGGGAGGGAGTPGAATGGRAGAAGGRPAARTPE